jgi:hypothetical protein
MKTKRSTSLGKFFGTLLMIALFTNVQGQEIPKETPAPTPTPHRGLQVSMFIGPSFGQVNSKIKDVGNGSFEGSGLHFSMRVGYALKKWAAGFTVGFNSLNIEKININNTRIDKGNLGSIDAGLSGLYVTRYFTPYNIFATVEAGTGKFSLSDAEGKILGETNSGFSWNLKVGKEFLLGKKKKMGIGAYGCLSGIRCKDKAPNASDIYTYISPGAGISLSFH